MGSPQERRRRYHPPRPRLRPRCGAVRPTSSSRAHPRAMTKSSWPVPPETTAAATNAKPAITLATAARPTCVPPPVHNALPCPNAARYQSRNRRERRGFSARAIPHLRVRSPRGTTATACSQQLPGPSRIQRPSNTTPASSEPPRNDGYRLLATVAGTVEDSARHQLRLRVRSPQATNSVSDEPARARNGDYPQSGAELARPREAWRRIRG